MMQITRWLTLAMVALLASGCSSFSGSDSPEFSSAAQWGLVPLVNYSQAPQAGERSEQAHRDCACCFDSLRSLNWPGRCSLSWPGKTQVRRVSV